MPRLPALPSRHLPLDVTRRFAGKPACDRPPQIQLHDPEPGYFRLKQARNGPWVPAIIWRPCPLILPDLLDETAPGPEDWCTPTERARPLRARIGDAAADPFAVWERGQRILPAEYRWRLALREWAIQHAPNQPEAKPRKRVKIDTLPSLF